MKFIKTHIKLAILPVIIILTAIPVSVLGKSMPDNMVITEDSLMLLLKAQPLTGLYDINQVKTISLRFDQSNWWQLLTNNYQSKTDIPSELTYEGVTYPGVGVRFRGQTSYQNVKNSKKKSFNISIDYTDSNQKLAGYKTLNLMNCFEDPSFMREALYTAFAGTNIPAAKVNFVRLVINDESWGLYANVQQLNGDFYEEWFLSNDGSSWRAEYPDTSTAKKGQGGGPGGGFGEGYCSLNYLGSQPIVYSRYYTLKSYTKEDPWADLEITCDKLNNLPAELLYDSLKYYLDVDRSLWHLANEIVFTDDDGYVNKGGMDYFVYWDIETGRLQPIEYDANSTFETKNVNWSPYNKETNIKYPLINRLLSNPQLKQRYVAHVRSIINNLMNEEFANAFIDKYKNLIDAEVQNDTKKLYTYQQFTNAITEIKNFIKNRRAYLLANNMIKAEPPVISSVEYESPNGINTRPFSGESVNIRATITANPGISKVLLYYGTGLMGTFSTVEMFDDGNHGDMAAGDGIYGTKIPAFPSGTYIRYYIESRSSNEFATAAFAPEGAEHDVYFYQVNSAIEENSPIVINEIMASNTKTVTDPQGDYEDWIELYNRSENPVNLTGCYLTDKSDNPKKWRFPDNTIVNSGEYLIIWADEDSKDTPNGIHTNFRLSTDGEMVLLVNSDQNGNTIMDQISFGPQESDISIGRYPNGSGPFLKMNPTPNRFNDNTVPVEEYKSVTAVSSINVYPNPINTGESIKLTFVADKPGSYSFDICNIAGEIVLHKTIECPDGGLVEFECDLTSYNGEKLSAGFYFIRLSNPLTFDTGSIKFIVFE